MNKQKLERLARARALVVFSGKNQAASRTWLTSHILAALQEAITQDRYDQHARRCQCYRSDKPAEWCGSYARLMKDKP